MLSISIPAPPELTLSNCRDDAIAKNSPFGININNTK